MATPGDLKRVVADVLGVPEPTVTVHDRNLAEAGLRSKGGRGRSAAQMTPEDAANLLIAVAGSSLVKDTVVTVREYSELPCKYGELSTRSGQHEFKIDGNPEPRWSLSEFPLPEMQALPEGHTFSAALAALLKDSRDGHLEAAIEAIDPVPGTNHRYWDLAIELDGPYPQARIRLHTHDFKEIHAFARHIPLDRDKLKAWAEERKMKGESGDLQQRRTFSGKTILKIGRLLKD